MTISAIILAAVLPVFDYATNSIAQRIAGADPAVCLSRFVNYPKCFGGHGVTRHTTLENQHSALSTNFWLKDVDFSCVSPWNDECGVARAGTLVSKRHVVFAKHFPLWKGCRILFVDRNGEPCPCRIEATKALPRGDVMIGLLDYEVTPNIQPAKILPDDYVKYIGDGRGLPVVTFNRQEKAYLSSVWKITTNTVSTVLATDPKGQVLSESIVGGDSGNPAFILIGDQPILIYCLYGGGRVGFGDSLFHYRKEIQNAMDELCPGYKLEEFDFKKLKEKIDDKHDSR